MWSDFTLVKLLKTLPLKAYKLVILIFFQISKLYYLWYNLL
jgi:hypothetical protein